MIDLFNILDNFISSIPDTIEKNGQLYKVELVPIKKEDLVDTTEVVDAFNEKISKMDPEIWESAVDIFSKKYNAKLFDELVSSKSLTKDKYDQLTNAIEAFNNCIKEAATEKINYLKDLYINGTNQTSVED